MSLSVGIVGLPNVGKSTLFNALLKKQQAYVANFPFATIEPNIGIVPVPDERLAKLAEVIKKAEGLDHLPPEVPATVQFLDIAGLIAGASKGEGLGNKFLSHIRETDAIAHVVRDFTDSNIVRHGSVEPKSDFKTVETELMLADLQTLEKQSEPRGTITKSDQFRWQAVIKLREGLAKGITARDITLSDEEKTASKQLSLLTDKAILVVLNVDENDLKKGEEIEKKYSIELGLENQTRLHAPRAQATGGQVVTISAKTEAELAELSLEEQKSYLKELGVEKSGLERLIQKAFSTLGLMTFLTAGEKEVRAWTIKKGMSAPQAAGVIHTDFTKGFIMADVISYDDYINFGGEKKCTEAGKVRQEGRDYIMQDGDVVEFKFNV
ncbi:MAG: redox-regulated ATPase YchF [Candidatus Gottesmanbacteria bacterium]